MPGGRGRMKPGCRIYLVRHGRTDWNQAKIFRGRADRPLAAEGRREAEALAKALQRVTFDAFYCSPLRRTRQTLAPLTRLQHKRIITAPGLTDINFGRWQGQTEAEVKAADPPRYRAWTEHPERVRFPGGETLAEAARRSLAALNEIARRHAGGTVAVCSHRVICKVLLLKLLGAELDGFWRLRQEAACINVFDYSPPRAVIYRLNDVCHLDRMSEISGADF